MANRVTAFRASMLHFLRHPQSLDDHQSYQYFADGLLVVQAGKVKAFGPASSLLPQMGEDVQVQQFQNSLIVPGFIDTHIHYPQMDCMAVFGKKLLDWLHQYTFPAEQKFADKQHAARAADVFLHELLRNGTTTALVFATVHEVAVEAFFRAAQKRNLRMISGKVLMDRNAPMALLDTPESGYHQSKALIERWHGQARLSYAVTPRFAPTSSDKQLALAGRLLQEHPDVYLHTHLAETKEELQWVSELFPASAHYLDVYHAHALVGERSVFAHGIHLCEQECALLAASGAAVSHCPTSNLFLGSGLFDLAKLERHHIKLALGTDIGAGTSFSMLQVAGEAYKVSKLKNGSLSPLKAFYLATLGGAQALQLADKIGNFTPGKEADFLLLDYAATPLLQARLDGATSIADKLFVMMTLGDDRLVARTYVLGDLAHSR